MRTTELAISLDEPGTLLSLAGRLSAATVADVRAALGTAIGCGTGDLVVDVERVDLVDASGLGVLVGAHRLALRSDRRLVLQNVPPRIDRLLVMTHLNRVLATRQVMAVEVDEPVSA